MPVTLLKAGQHTCLGRLTDGEGLAVGDLTKLDRPCMLVYCGKFDSMDGPVEITEEHVDRLIANHNGRIERLRRAMGLDEVPVRDNPPLQLDHSTSAQVTVGRVPGKLYKAPYTNPDSGETVTALFCERVRVLGRENVEKVADGRWAHVSIGADLEVGKLNELSITPFPAAGNASLLSKRKLSEGDHGMHEKLKKHLMDARKMSAEDADKLSKEVLSGAQKKLGKNDDDMTAHMATADDAECKRMTEEHDEEKKKLAKEEEDKAKLAKEEEDKQRLAKEEEDKKAADAKMTGAQRFIKLAKGLKVQGDQLRMDIRLAGVGSNLARLRSAGKITPAEIKKIDLSSFGKMSQEAVDAALKSYEDRQPLVHFGAMVGTTKADALSKVQAKYRLARMELDSRMNMPSKRKEAEVAMKRLSEEEKQELSQVEAELPTKGQLSSHPKFEELCKMLNEGKHDELKGHMRRMCDHLETMGTHLSEGDEQRMSALAKTQTALQNQFDELVALASPALGVKLDEI